MIPIPGTTRITHLREDLGAAQVQLGDDLLTRLDRLINSKTVAGVRYAPQATLEVDTEEVPQ